jgi:hypothetical protein
MKAQRSHSLTFLPYGSGFEINLRFGIAVVLLFSTSICYNSGFRFCIDVVDAITCIVSHVYTLCYISGGIMTCLLMRFM